MEAVQYVAQSLKSWQKRCEDRLLVCWGRKLRPAKRRRESERDNNNKPKLERHGGP